MVSFPSVAHVDNHRVIEHGSIPLRNAPQLSSQPCHQLDVVGADSIAAFLGGLPIRASAMTNGMDILFA